MPTRITPERPDSPDATALIGELQTELEALYPPESNHGYSVERLVGEGVAFFVVRHDGSAAGCGGIKVFRDYAELKRMYVRPAFRGLGLGKRMLQHLTDYAQDRGVGVVRLETGIHQDAAIGLYERMGFERIGPFGAYEPDPLSRYYEKRLR